MTIETVKLKNKKGDVIERYKHDYENNVERFNMRGWFLDNGKVDSPKEEKPLVLTEEVKDKPLKKKKKKKKSK
tara:strand:- start:32 stop:250 length:219 start_codon:yes stop_codon:yes gene_type:complete